jgi:hypothetical protein
MAMLGLIARIDARASAGQAHPEPVMAEADEEEYA